MRKISIAFDIDGTLRCNKEERHKTEVEPNPEVVSTLKWLARCKNVEVHLWSNRGAEYCQEMRKTLGLEKQVKAKNCHLKEWKTMQQVEVKSGSFKDDTYMMTRADAFTPDIAFDDQQAFDGAELNVIVREK